MCEFLILDKIGTWGGESRDKNENVTVRLLRSALKRSSGDLVMMVMDILGLNTHSS